MSAIKHIRKKVFDLSQAELAEIAGVTQATVSRWEAGEFEPGLNEMRRIREEALARGLAWDDALFFDAQESGGDAQESSDGQGASA